MASGAEYFSETHFVATNLSVDGWSAMAESIRKGGSFYKTKSKF